LATLRSLIVVALLLPLAARAEKPRLLVLPFTGPHSKQAQTLVASTLKKRATILPPKSASKPLARVIISGTVKKDGRTWELVVTVRAGKSFIQKLRYPLKGPRPNGVVLSTLRKEIKDTFDSALASGGGEATAEEGLAPTDKISPQRSETPPPEPAAPPPVAQKPPEQPAAAPPPAATTEAPPRARVEARNEEEEPPLRKRAVPGRASEEPATKPAEYRPAGSVRPRWAPYLGVTAGFSLTGRSFDFDNPGAPKFTSGVVPGIHGDVEVYQLAFSWNRAGGVFAGLGLGATVDKPFWPTSVSKTDPNQRITTNELRFEGALRWNITLYKPVPRPQIMLQAGYGIHQFQLGKDSLGNDIGPPDVEYKYLTFGAGLRLWPAEFVDVWVLANYHVVLATGPISDRATEYGDANALGLRGSGGIDFYVYRGLKVGAMGFYERFALSFGTNGVKQMQATTKVNSGIDQYFGGIITVGYML
jgi:hypothetical protein